MSEHEDFPGDRAYDEEGLYIDLMGQCAWVESQRAKSNEYLSEPRLRASESSRSALDD